MSRRPSRRRRTRRQPRQHPVYIPPPPSETNPVPQTQAPPQPQSSLPSKDSGAYPPLRITSQPMDAKAAQAQALFAEQTDGQVTQGSASQIHALGNAPVTLPSSSVHAALGPNGQPVTPPDRLTAPPNTRLRHRKRLRAPIPHRSRSRAARNLRNKPPPPPRQLLRSSRRQPHRHRREPSGKKSKPKARTQTVPTLVTAPGEPNPSQVTVTVRRGGAPETPQAGSGKPGSDSTGVSDEELQQRNLPPLRGPWVRVQREARVISPREEAEAQLQSLESGYSAWMGGGRNDQLSQRQPWIRSPVRARGSVRDFDAIRLQRAPDRGGQDRCSSTPDRPTAPA